MYYQQRYRNRNTWKVYRPRYVRQRQKKGTPPHDVMSYTNKRNLAICSHNVETNRHYTVALMVRIPHNAYWQRCEMTQVHDVMRRLIKKTQITCSYSVETIQLIAHAITRATVPIRGMLLIKLFAVLPRETKLGIILGGMTLVHEKHRTARRHTGVLYITLSAIKCAESARQKSELWWKN